MNRSGAGDRGTGDFRLQCEICIDLLDELASIHMEIDPPTRSIRTDEPNLVCRLRKICLHVLAIKGWEIGPDVEHVMATELRAAYVQMDAVWKCVPGEFWPDETDRVKWADEARSGMLATYDHPTPQTLIRPLGRGGFGDGEDRTRYVQLAIWLGHLGVGYGLALAYLAQILDAEVDVTSRVTAGLHRFQEIGP